MLFARAAEFLAKRLPLGTSLVALVSEREQRGSVRFLQLGKGGETIHDAELLEDGEGTSH